MERLARSLNEKDRHYQLDGETAGHGTNNTYVYGLDLISVTGKGGNQSYFLYDGLGSTTNLTDGSANVTASYGYDVFGALRSGSLGATPFLFTGEQRDTLTSLYYLRARYYDPAIGRFLGQDPVPGGNLYAVGHLAASLKQCIALRIQVKMPRTTMHRRARNSLKSLSESGISMSTRLDGDFENVLRRNKLRAGWDAEGGLAPG